MSILSRVEQRRVDVLLVQGIRQGAGDEIHLTNSGGHFSYPMHLIREEGNDRDKLVAESTPGMPNTGALKEAECTSHGHTDTSGSPAVWQRVRRQTASHLGYSATRWGT